MAGMFNSNVSDQWIFLVGASTAGDANDNHYVDDVEVSYWTRKRVPMPPYQLTYMGATPSSVTISWYPHEDDGGSPVRRYRVRGYSVNATCSADERSP